MVIRRMQALFLILFAAMSVHAAQLVAASEGISSPPPQVLEAVDVTGEWEIQEEDKSYTATLDKDGNGPYTWQAGRITTLNIADRKWQGTWQQPGNDREGGFELLLSEDAMEAKGVWWYTRVGDRKNIPARQWGGNYAWKRLHGVSSPPSSNP